jgi:hypothetical protein
LHVAPGAVRCIADGNTHTSRLADSHAHAASIVTNDRDDAKSEATPSLDNGSHPVDVDDPLVQFISLSPGPAPSAYGHDPSDAS